MGRHKKFCNSSIASTAIMKLIDAQMQLLNLKQPALQTSDASACLQVSRAYASQILVRLAKAGLVVQVSRGLWVFPDKFDPLLLPEYLTAPFPSYISLQTALYYHGMIEQIPQVIYAVSIARTKKILTPLGDVSIHHIDPNFFIGFDLFGAANIKMACPEKALLDTLYLQATKTLLFKKLPELELPKNFNIKKSLKMIEHISSQRLRTLVTNQLNIILEK